MNLQDTKDFASKLKRRGWIQHQDWTCDPADFSMYARFHKGEERIEVRMHGDQFPTLSLETVWTIMKEALKDLRWFSGYPIEINSCGAFQWFTPRQNQMLSEYIEQATQERQ